MTRPFLPILVAVFAATLAAGAIPMAKGGPGGPTDCPDHDGDGICNGKDPDYLPGMNCPNPDCPNSECPNPPCPNPEGPNPECPNPNCPSPECPGPHGPQGPNRPHGPGSTAVLTLLAACCFDDGSCLNLPRTVCFEEGGWPHDVGMYCSMIHCEGPRPIPCCLPDGTCEELQPRICNRRGGQPRYGSGFCEDVTCP